MERRPRLDEKVAIVTGAGSQGTGVGNGKATAILFAREGARVLLVDNVEERVMETQSVIKSEGGEASTFVADVTKANDCEMMVNTAIERYGKLDILHNNVGMSMRKTVVDVTEEQWNKIMTLNVKSIVLTSKYSIPKMIQNGGGSIINISSTAGIRAHSSTPYTTSKAAIIGLTFSMAADHGPNNIRVNCILPGLVHTPFVGPRMNEILRQDRMEASPLRTEGTGWDIGWAAVYLASDEARWVTGIVLPVDAGLTITSPVTYNPLTQQITH